MLKTKTPENKTVWEQRYNEFRSSGKSQAAWCNENNINPRTFNFWYLRFKSTKTQSKKQSKEPVKWLALNTDEINIKSETNPVQTSTINVRIANVTIEVKPGFEPEHLLNIIKTLGKLC